MQSRNRAISLGITSVIAIVIVLVLGFGIYLNGVLISTNTTVTIGTTIATVA